MCTQCEDNRRTDYKKRHETDNIFKPSQGIQHHLNILLRALYRIDVIPIPAEKGLALRTVFHNKHVGTFIPDE